MDLEGKLVLGILFVSEGLLSFEVAKLAYHTNKVKIATTKFLNSITNYLSARVSKPGDIKSLAELAKYRKEIKI